MADSDPAAKEAAVKARVISHMNKDHAGELELYLRAFSGLSASGAANPQITHMYLDGLAIKSASGTHTVAIEPPLPNWGASRVRLVEMAQAALTKLDLSDIKIDRYAPPAGFDLVVLFGITLYFVCAATLSFVKPGTASWDALDAFFPVGGAEAYRWLVKTIFVPVVAIHITESWWMAKTRLVRHRVPTGSKIWWLWTIAPFFEGFMAFKRFDGVVAAEQQKKAAAKH